MELVCGTSILLRNCFTLMKCADKGLRGLSLTLQSLGMQGIYHIRLPMFGFAFKKSLAVAELAEAWWPG